MFKIRQDEENLYTWFPIKIHDIITEQPRSSFRIENFSPTLKSETFCSKRKNIGVNSSSENNNKKDREGEVF